MQCPRCQHENPAAVKFCGECGAKLEARCLQCGSGNPPGNKFCRECGATLGAATSQAKPSSPDAYTPQHLEFGPRSTDRLPFHDPDEAEQAQVGATTPSQDARIRHLQRVPLFREFSEGELHRVAELSTIVELPAGTVVTQMGEPGNSFFIIIDGTVAVHTPIGAGSQLQPGDFFGEMSLLDGEPRSATITATTDVRLLMVDRSHFWRLLDETPELIRRILMLLSLRVRRLEQTANAILRGTKST
jgi:CRP/FNR family transcriptional regulator, cyclic AMP receptor protein